MSKSRNDGLVKFVRLQACVGNSVMFRCYVTILPSSALTLDQENLPLYVIINAGFVSFQYQVLFEAERKGYAGDIALDEIRLTPGSCRQFVVTTTLPPPPPTTKQPTPSVTQGMFCSGESRGDGFIRSLHLWLVCPFVFAPFKAQQSKFILKGYNFPLAWAQPSVLEVVKGEYGINKREERKLFILVLKFTTL